MNRRFLEPRRDWRLSNNYYRRVKSIVYLRQNPVLTLANTKSFKLIYIIGYIMWQYKDNISIMVDSEIAGFLVYNLKKITDD